MSGFDRTSTLRDFSIRRTKTGSKNPTEKRERGKIVRYGHTGICSREPLTDTGRISDPRDHRIVMMTLRYLRIHYFHLCSSH